MVTFSALESAEGDGSMLVERFTSRGRWRDPPGRWDAESPEDLLLRHEILQRLEAAIAGLPAGQRAVVTLKDIEGLETSEVCNVLGITETNQRVLLYRARTRIRAALEEYVERR